MASWILDEVITAMKPPKGGTFIDFLKTNFMLNKEDNISVFKIELTPWLKGVANWIDDPNVEWVNLIQASQTGKTTLEMAFLLYIAQKEPTRVMWIHSTEEEAKQFVTERLRPYIDIYDFEAVKKRRWKMEAFTVYNAKVKISYATNEQTLRGVPAQYVIGDECAVWKFSAELVKKRTRTYTGKRKGIFVTTPPRVPEHHSWKEVIDADFYRWYVPCPKCHIFQPLIMNNLKWEGKVDREWDHSKIKETVRYECAKCGHKILEENKSTMINAGKLVCVDPFDEYKERSERGLPAKTLQVSSLYSMFTTWGELATNFIRAKKLGMESLKVFITDELAEVPIGLDSFAESVKEELLVKYKGVEKRGYRDGFDVYTVGIDVQRNGELFCVLSAWKKGVIPSPAVLDYKCISWQGGNFEVRWSQLLAWIAPFRGKIARAVLDATDGLVSQEIYDFCNATGKPFLPLKDTTSLHLKTVIKTTNPEIAGKKSNRLQTMLFVNSDQVKDDIAAAFNRQPHEIGSWDFPIDAETDFFRSLTMEHRVTGRTGKSAWEPKYNQAPNHYFSALVYSTAAMEEFRPLLQENIAIQVSNIQRQRIIRKGYNIWH